MKNSIAATYTPHEILIAPLMSEKSVNLDGAMAFWVHSKATKQDIRRAVESIFKVDVAKVRTATKRFYSSRVRKKASPLRVKKKAYVILAEGQEINLSNI